MDKIFIKYKKPFYFANNKLLVDKFIINKFMSGESYSSIADTINQHMDWGFDHNNVKRYVSNISHNFKIWNERPISKHYLLVMIYSFWIEAPNFPRFKKKRIDIITGIDEYGKFEYLSFHIFSNHYESYWSFVFETLMKRGIKRIDLLCSDFNLEIKSVLKKWVSNSSNLIGRFMSNAYINEIYHLTQALNKSKKSKNFDCKFLDHLDVLKSLDDLNEYLSLINKETNNKLLTHTTNLQLEFKKMKIYELGKNLKTIFFMYVYSSIFNSDLKKIQDHWCIETPFDYDHNIQKCLYLLIDYQNDVDMNDIISVEGLKEEIASLSLETDE